MTGLVTYLLLGLMLILLIGEVIRSFVWRYNMRKEKRTLEGMMGKEPKHVNLFVSPLATQHSDDRSGEQGKIKLDVNLSARSGDREELKSED